MQTILKKLHTHPMSNEKEVAIPDELIQNKNLSYRSLGILVDLLSRPDNSNLDEFIKSQKMLTKEKRLKDKFIKVTDELENNGYMIVSTQPMTADEINSVKLNK